MRALDDPLISSMPTVPDDRCLKKALQNYSAVLDARKSSSLDSSYELPSDPKEAVAFTRSLLSTLRETSGPLSPLLLRSVSESTARLVDYQPEGYSPNVVTQVAEHLPTALLTAYLEAKVVAPAAIYLGAQANFLDLVTPVVETPPQSSLANLLVSDLRAEFRAAHPQGTSRAISYADDLNQGHVPGWKKYLDHFGINGRDLHAKLTQDPALWAKNGQVGIGVPGTADLIQLPIQEIARGLASAADSKDCYGQSVKVANIVCPEADGHQYILVMPPQLATLSQVKALKAEAAGLDHHKNQLLVTLDRAVINRRRRQTNRYLHRG